MRASVGLVAILCLPLVACALYSDSDGHGGPAPSTHDCATYTGRIYEPADGATVAAPVRVRMRWNEDNVPDRYSSMSDDFNHYFIPSDFIVNGDGSETNVYTDVPAGATLTFEMGWICDAGNEGPEILLDTITFHVAP